MNITRLNFKETFPFILSSVEQANFIALDFEMSGIVSAFTLDPSLTDTVQTRYHKNKCKAQRFIPLQLGLCPFKIDPKNYKVTYSPFNIYLYPFTLSQRESQQFSFNSQSMRFLAKNNFDFNKLFYQGVPFLSTRRMVRQQVKTQEIKLREEQTKGYMLNSPDVAAFINMKLAQVTNWITIQVSTSESKQQSQQPQLQSSTSDSPLSKQNLTNSEQNEKQIFIDIQHARVRAYQSLIYVIKKKYPSLALQFQYLDRDKNKLDSRNFLSRKYLKITKLTPQQSSKQSTPIQTPQSRQTQSLQMNKIWQTIKQKQIPLVVHNGYLDLMHLYHRFIDDLPPHQSVYRKSVNTEFPYIYDTKYLCNNSPVLFNKLNKDTSLGNCYKILRQLQIGKKDPYKQPQTPSSSSSTVLNQIKQQVKSQISTFCSGYKFDEQEHHQAGFDALMTGYTFVNAMKILCYPPEKMVAPQFHTSAQYFSNKVPMGNIRLPFNFGGNIQNYEQDGNRQFYFTCLEQKVSPSSTSTPSSTASTSSPTTVTSTKTASTLTPILTPQSFMQKQTQFYNHFSKLYGPVRIVWQDKNQYNFTLTFFKPQDQQKFIKNFNKNNGDFAIYNIQNDSRYLISTKLLPGKLFTATGSNK